MKTSGIRPFSHLIDLALREIDMTDYEDLTATASNSPILTRSSMSLRIKQRWWSTCNTATIDGLKSNIAISRSKPQIFVSGMLGCIFPHSWPHINIDGIGRWRKDSNMVTGGRGKRNKRDARQYSRVFSSSRSTYSVAQYLLCATYYIVAYDTRQYMMIIAIKASWPLSGLLQPRVRSASSLDARCFLPSQGTNDSERRLSFASSKFEIIDFSFFFFFCLLISIGLVVSGFMHVVQPSEYPFLGSLFRSRNWGATI